MAEEILSQIEELQEKIKSLSNLENPVKLPLVPMKPNISRSSNEMWQIYSYELSKYESLQTLPTEEKFLSIIESYQDVSDIHSLVKNRLDLLSEKRNITKPTLRSPTTSVLPLSLNDKIERAKLIAQHLVNSQKMDRMEVMGQITKCQTKLMELEEQYLETV
jgi:hypothetical protein